MLKEKEWVESRLVRQVVDNIVGPVRILCTKIQVHSIQSCKLETPVPSSVHGFYTLP